MLDLEKELDFAFELAESAAREIMPRFRFCSIEHKADGTEVTDADRSAERVMRELITLRFPNDAVLGEESGMSGNETASRVWVLDPIDGTAWFTMGVPLFGTLIALCENGEPVLGLINFPPLHETVYATTGSGCWFKPAAGNVYRLQVADKASLHQATISATSLQISTMPLHMNKPSYNLSGIMRQARKFKFVGDCLQHALVARGTIHAAIDPVMKPWDIAALVPCIEEAGGIVTDLQGNRKGILESDNLLASCSDHLHDEILAVLNAGIPTGD
jgi:histidinol-phosphatase